MQQDCGRTLRHIMGRNVGTDRQDLVCCCNNRASMSEVPFTCLPSLDGVQHVCYTDNTRVLQ